MSFASLSIHTNFPSASLPIMLLNLSVDKTELFKVRFYKTTPLKKYFLSGVVLKTYFILQVFIPNNV